MIIKLIDDNLRGQPGLCPFINSNTNWVRDVEKYDIAIYTDRLCYSNVDSSKSNYAWLIEPPIINGENYRDIHTVASKFKKVFSHNINLANRIPNFVYCPHGGTWLEEKDINLNANNKKELISFIFSDKQWNSYHRLRHRIYNMLLVENIDNKEKINFFGSGCNNKINRKSEALSSYMFSLVIENSEEDDYFTEKIIDCFLTGTIPIYLGNKNIGKYFNEQGIIRFREPEQLSEIFKNLTSEFYYSKIDAIIQNFDLAKNYIHPEQLITKNILENE